MRILAISRKLQTYYENLGFYLRLSCLLICSDKQWEAWCTVCVSLTHTCNGWQTDDLASWISSQTWFFHITIL
mgnify:CR=1 FL=1